MTRRNWTREELIVALNVYCKIPFKDSDKDHPLIKEIAPLIGRTSDALNLKIGNFGRLDPALAKKGISGLKHGSKLEVEVWNEFYGDFDALAFESECILANLRGKSVESTISTDQLPEGKEREAVVKQRVNQNFFRAMVLSAYNNTCCVSGLQHNNLLEASHIIDWGKDLKNRTNPHNGLCLNHLIHRAYDQLLLGITPDGIIKVSDAMLASHADRPETLSWLKSLNGKSIILPRSFQPSRDFLAIHYEKFLKA